MLNQNYLYKMHKIDIIYLFFLCFIYNVQYIKHGKQKSLNSLIIDAKKTKEEILHLE